jgi:hypothetical protein
MPTNSGAANGNPCAHEMALQQRPVMTSAMLEMVCSLIVALLDLMWIECALDRAARQGCGAWIASGIGIIGCGNISQAYLKDAPTFPILEVRGGADLRAAWGAGLSGERGERTDA